MMIDNLRNPNCTFKAILVDEDVVLDDKDFVVFTNFNYEQFAKIIMDKKLKDGILLPFDIVFISTGNIYAAVLNYYTTSEACITYFELLEIEDEVDFG
jgi:hypothetical protein